MKTIVVYRVEEVNPPPGVKGPHTWKVAAIEAYVHRKTIQLTKRFWNIEKIMWQPDALGRVFFETPLQAIDYFKRSQMALVESHQRCILENQRAIAWAQEQQR